MTRFYISGFLVLLLLVCSSQLYAQGYGNSSVGIRIGDPTGIEFQYKSDSDIHLSAAFGRYFNFLRLDIDALLQEQNRFLQKPDYRIYDSYFDNSYLAQFLIGKGVELNLRWQFLYQAGFQYRRINIGYRYESLSSSGEWFLSGERELNITDLGFIAHVGMEYYSLRKPISVYILAGVYGQLNSSETQPYNIQAALGLRYWFGSGDKSKTD